MLTACLFLLAIVIVIVAIALPNVYDNAMMMGSMPFIAKTPYGYSHADIPDMSGKLVLVTGTVPRHPLEIIMTIIIGIPPAFHAS